MAELVEEQEQDKGLPARDLMLIPNPRSVFMRGATLRPPPSLFFHLPAKPMQGLRQRADIIAEQIVRSGIRMNMATSSDLVGYQAMMTLSPTLPKNIDGLDKPLRGLSMQPEGYRLTVNDQGILFQANDELGFYYAGQTLRQLVENGRTIPGCIIEDAPLIACRGIHWNLSGWPPRREYLEQVIDRFSKYKFNLLILEYERHFNYLSQPGVCSEHALTAKDVAELATYAEDRGITLIPLLPGLGDTGFLLRLPPYADLREHPNYWQEACPSNPISLDIYMAMTEDLIACHPGPLFHAGGSHVRFLGACPECQRRSDELGGRSSLFLDHMGRIARYLLKRGKIPIMWDEQFRRMTNEQIQWLPPETILTMGPQSPGISGGPAEQGSTLDRFLTLGRKAWGTALVSPARGFESYDQLDHWAHAAELGWISGMIASIETRDYSMGPLLPPLETQWAGILYAAERSWGGRKNSQRGAFSLRFGARHFGLNEEHLMQWSWDMIEFFQRDFPREARDKLKAFGGESKRNKRNVTFMEVWCRMLTFEHYVKRFERGISSTYSSLQTKNADPFHAGRQRYRVEQLRSVVPDLAQNFREEMLRITFEEDIEEFLNCQLAYGLSQLDMMAGMLDPYPIPDKEWRQSVRL